MTKNKPDSKRTKKSTIRHARKVDNRLSKLQTLEDLMNKQFSTAIITMKEEG